MLDLRVCCGRDRVEIAGFHASGREGKSELETSGEVMVGFEAGVFL
jgi:hypothetical protein